MRTPEDERARRLLESPGARTHFLAELRTARATALADAESFDQVLFAVERLGARLTGKVQGLGSYFSDLRALADLGAPERYESHPDIRSRFERVFWLVCGARNDALHQGAVARHMTISCVELALMLENGMSSGARVVKDLMVEAPVVAKSFETVGSVRRTMLLNSFSFLPTYFEKEWWLVCDAELVRYLRAAQGPSDRNRRLGTTLANAVAGGLTLQKPAGETDGDADLQTVLQNLDQRPVLVIQSGMEGPDSLRGIITPFDLL